MPIDAATLLAELDRMIEGLGAVHADDAEKPVVFGQFGQRLDSQRGSLSNDKPLKGNEFSDFGQFGQQICDNDHIDLELTADKNFVTLENATKSVSVRSRVEKKSTVQTVQLSKSVQSSFHDGGLEFGQCLDSGTVTVQNTDRLQKAETAASASVFNLIDAETTLRPGLAMPRAWTDGYAALCAMPPPDGFWPDRWRRLVDAAGMFLDRWASEAARCGWTTLDAFGCHPEAPAARFDCMGLALLLGGVEVVAIDEGGADLVAISTGARQRFRRRTLPLGTVPLWEIVR